MAFSVSHLLLFLAVVEEEDNSSRIKRFLDIELIVSLFYYFEFAFSY